MLRDTVSKFSKGLICAMMLACSAMVPPVLADDAGALTVRITPTSQNQISLGEPFVVHYRFDNADPTAQVTFHAGPDNDQWYTLTLRGQGGLVSQAPKLPQKKQEGLSLSPERSIRTGDHLSGDFVATRGLVVPAPGRYTLTVHVDTPYFVEPQRGGMRYTTPGTSDPPSGMLTQDFDFPLVVTPIDPAKLQRTAERLKRAILDPVNAASSRSLVEQLFSLPEAQALPSWKALIAAPTSYSSVLEETVNQLSRLRTDTAADLLVQMQHRPGNASGYTPRVDGALAEMYNTGSSTLRKHIKALAASQGAELSEKLTSPSNPN